MAILGFYVAMNDYNNKSIAISQSYSITVLLRCNLAEADAILIKLSKCLTTIFKPLLFLDSALN